MPTEARGFFIFFPESFTVPLSGNNNPDIKRVRVDLPQPDGPTTAVKPFFFTFNDRSLRTGNGPVLVL